MKSSRCQQIAKVAGRLQREDIAPSPAHASATMFRSGMTRTKENEMRSTAVLLISCPDQKGLVATVSDFIFRHGGNTLHTDEHTDAESVWFLMRVEFDPS